MTRWAKRHDGSQNEIVAALRQAGVQVWIMERPCDLLTRFRGVWLPLEVKLPRAKPRKDQAAQQQFLQENAVPIVRTAEEALQAVGAIKGA